MNFRTGLLVFLKVFVSYCAVGQAASDSRFLPNDINDRLPHSDINSIIQDRSGFLWFATYGGLCKYDGKNLTVFDREAANPNSLSSSRILCLAELADGSLLIGTEGGGLNHFFPNYQSFQVYRNDQAVNSLSGDVVNTIHQASDGSIWVGTNSGLDIMHPGDSSTYFEKIFNSPQGVSAIVEDYAGNIVFSSGLRIFEKKLNENRYHLKAEFGSGIKSILPLRDGRLLIGCENGLFSRDENGVTKIFEYPIINFYLSHDSSIWAGTRGYGLFKLNNELKVEKRFTANKSDPTSLTFDEVSCLYEDHSGVLWVGTYGRGLNKLDLRAKKFQLYTNRPWEKNSLSGDRVISFFEDSQKKLWIGLRGGGINILDTENKIIPISEKPGAPFYGQSVSSFYEDPKGGIWIGTWGGGIVVLPKEKIQNLINGGHPKLDTLFAGPHSVEKIVDDYEGNVWLSTTNGLFQYVPVKSSYYKGEFRRYGSNDSHAPLTDNFIRDIYIERGKVPGEKIIWVGTINGLNRLTIKEYEHSVLKIKSNPSNPQTLPSDFISVIMKDRHDSLWISCLGGGVAQMIGGRDGKSETRFKNYNNSNGLPNNEIETILEDELGHFWMGGYGLTKFDPQTGDLVGFDLNDGLQSNAFKVWAALKKRDGKFVFGGTKGFNIFAPNEIEVNSIPPKLAFTDIKFNNKDLHTLQEEEGYTILDSTILVTRKVELPYKLNSFTISFSSLHYTSPENNKLKFKLEGVDADWVIVTG
jgi:ligand-binding sensor domain-containing protein